MSLSRWSNLNMSGMKKKVLPQYYHSYSTLELGLIAVCKAFFVGLKKQKIMVVPYGYYADEELPHAQLHPKGPLEESQFNFIEHLVFQGKEHIKAGEASCFAVAFDAHVLDEESIDEDALAILLFKEDGQKVQINVPYVLSEDDLVFGEEWLA